MKLITIAVLALLTTAGVKACREVPGWAANGLLHPTRRTVPDALRNTYREATFVGAGVTLRGWHFPAGGERRGTVVYLHGVADNRVSAIGPAEHFSRQGFDVIAYDSRAHGDSEGEACTYGFYEKQDLKRVLDTIDSGPIAVAGISLGAAVALQTAAVDSRIRAVVAVESFSDLRTVASERGRRFLTRGMIRRAFAIAEEKGQFDVDTVSPVEAARHITVPVFLVHGALDRETPPAHSQRIFDALAGPRRLLIVEGAGHNQSLTPAAWEAIEQWLRTALADGDR